NTYKFFFGGVWGVQRWATPIVRRAAPGPPGEVPVDDPPPLSAPHDAGVRRRLAAPLHPDRVRRHRVDDR
ncbi:hypothetical protein, partial [Streptomyces sp. NPDC006333]|uniref:hypothetical protein n=1 Tax=Streptomyces sp. NPDC006333 TaxID=3156753 RepID=UPI0033AF69FE